MNTQRSELDGLRALAVIAVILNHFDKGTLPSGYLGVDIFFVLSGFVITTSLVNRKTDRFQDFLMGFYIRRVKRLIPALVINILITSVLVCLFDPDSVLSLRVGQPALAGFSNIALYRASMDYFAASTEFNVFTHTWSLGVEEQFYALFPLLFWGAGIGGVIASGTRRFVGIVGALSAVSLFAFIFLHYSDQPAAYFLMPARFWELGTGCLLVPLLTMKAFRNVKERVPPSLILLLLAGTLVVPQHFSVPATVIVTLLTALLIATIRPLTAAFKLLTYPPVIYIGLTSYSLYLWHWSVLSISRWTIGIHWWSIPLQIALMFLLAVASYRYVETPLRVAEWSPIRWKTIAFGVAALVFAAVVLAGLRGPFYGRLYSGVRPPPEPEACGSDARRPYWIVGDSHAAEFSKALYTAVSGNCSFERHESGNSFLFAHESDGTRENDGLPLRSVQLLSPQPFIEYAKRYRPTVIVVNIYFVGFFSPESFSLGSSDWIVRKRLSVDHREIPWTDALNDEIENLRSVARELSGTTAMVIVLPEPEFNWVGNGGPSNGKCDLQWFNFGRLRSGLERTCAAYLTPAIVPIAEVLARRERVVSLLTKVKTESKNVFLYDTVPVLCEGVRCATHTIDGVRLFMDDDHIGDNAIKLLGTDLNRFLRDNHLLGPTLSAGEFRPAS
jgi:peptidoglycan/LPS O-acetylase OafA/YrhL